MSEVQRPISPRRVALRTVAKHRRLRRMLRGLAAFYVVEQGCWLVILLFAYEQGGVGEVGVVAAALLVPAVLFAPVVATGAEFLPRHRVIPLGLLLVAVAGVATGAAMTADASSLVVYAAATVFSVLLTFAGPASGAVLPTIAETPDQLTAANMAVGFIETAGRLAGPIVAGALLAVTSTGPAMMLIGAVAAVGALVTLERAPDAPITGFRHADDPDRPGFVAEFAAGVRLLARDGQVRTLASAIAATGWIAGALDVGAAAIAFEVLGRDESAISVLITGFGLGGLLGSLLSFGLVGRQRLARSLIGSVLVMGLAFAVLGWSPEIVTATSLLVLVGAATTVTAVAGRTMLQGLTPDDTLARIFGVLEALEAAALALGGLVLSVLAVQLGVAQAFAVVGAVSIIGLLAVTRSLRSIDRARRPADARVLRLARSSPIFSPLPPYAMEHVMYGLTNERFDAGAVLMTKGEQGTRMCLLAEGSVEVHLRSGEVLTRMSGDVIGEIALLRQSPRTATVCAGPEGAEVYWMDGSMFLDAVNRAPRSRARADAQAERRLSS